MKADEYSNAAYLLPLILLVAVSPNIFGLPFYVVAILWLVIGSWGLHRYQSDEWKKLDITGLTAVASTLAAGVWWPLSGKLLWLVVPFIWVMYLYLPANYWLHEIREQIHTAVWALIILVGLFLQVGWVVVVPFAVFAIGNIFRSGLSGMSYHYSHAVWHVLASISITLAIPSILQYLV